MTQVSNCIVCATEFEPIEAKGTVSSLINNTNFKICENCLNACDPHDDYIQARNIVNSYLNFSEVKNLFSEASTILNDLNKNKL